MNTDENTTENISAYHDNGPPNYDLIAEYLQLPRPRELASLAASMAIKNTKFDPVALVKIAEELRLQARQTFVARQTELLNQMNSNTLKALHFTLHGNKDRDFHGYDHKDRLHHVTAGPLVCRFQAAGRGLQKHLLKLSCLEAEAVLRQVQTQMDRPQLPCNLVDGLLWVTGEPRKARDVVVLAHHSYIASEFAKSAENHFWRTIEADEWQLTLKKEALFEISFHESADDGSLDEHQFHKLTPEEALDKIGQFELLIDDNQEVQALCRNLELRRKEANGVGAYIENPSPSNIPAVIIKYAIEQLLQENDRIMDELELAAIAKGFHEFWMKCDRRQLKAVLKDKKKAKNKDEVKSRIGAKGNQSIQRDKLQELTSAFCKYLAEYPTLFGSEEDLHVAINGFMSGESRPRRVSQKLAIDYFGALWNAARNPDSASGIIQNQLQRDGFKFVDKELMFEMLNLTSVVFQHPESPNSEKRKPRKARQKS